MYHFVFLKRCVMMTNSLLTRTVSSRLEQSTNASNKQETINIPFFGMEEVYLYKEKKTLLKRQSREYKKDKVKLS